MNPGVVLAGNKIFLNDIEIDYSKLNLEPFKTETRKVINFDCGNQSLNEFLTSDEVFNYENEKLGTTTLVYFEGELVAYYTTSGYLLKKIKMKSAKGFSKFSEYRIEGFPSILIGRLAVQNEWKGKGIGRYLVTKIIRDTYNSSGKFGLRLVVVQAKEEAFDFYIKLGFQFIEHSSEDKRFKAKGTRGMFFDLKSLQTLK